MRRMVPPGRRAPRAAPRHPAWPAQPAARARYHGRATRTRRTRRLPLPSVSSSGAPASTFYPQWGKSVGLRRGDTGAQAQLLLRLGRARVQRHNTDSYHDSAVDERPSEERGMATQQERELFLRGWRAAMHEALAVLESEADEWAAEAQEAGASSQDKLPGS